MLRPKIRGSRRHGRVEGIDRGARHVAQRFRPALGCRRRGPARHQSRTRRTLQKHSTFHLDTISSVERVAFPHRIFSPPATLPSRRQRE